MASISFGLSIPVGLIQLERLLNLVELADNLNYDTFWVHENPIYGDSFAIIAILSQLNKKIKLGIGCTSVITRHPIMIASSAVTLQNLSGGRFILGLGLGGFPWLPLIGYPIYPVKETKPLKRIAEAVKIIKALTNGERVHYEGKFYRINGFALFTKPTKYIPIYIASLSEKTLSYAPSFADGVITSPGVMTPKDIERMLNWVKKGEEKYNKKIIKACYVLVSVAENDREAIEAVKRDPYFLYQLADVVKEESLIEYGVKIDKMKEIREAWMRRDLSLASKLVSDEMVLALTATGSKENALSRFESFFKIGYDTFIISPVGKIEEAIKTFSR
jgi:alkanesulfonate monooxygenase SsuD/methylene tetrahydromethanopterin reductase-like flavin-dependent oxidoreductase (luciferase family)